MATVLGSTNQRGISVELRENENVPTGDARYDDWITINKDYSSQRHVTLDEITPPADPVAHAISQHIRAAGAA